MFKSLSSSFSGRIGHKLVWRILLFSLLITLVSSGLTIYLDHRQGVVNLHRSLTLLAEHNLRTLAHGLWVLQEDQVKLQLEAVTQVEDVAYAAVLEEGEVLWQSGSLPATSMIRKSYPLRVIHRGEEQYLGTFDVAASLEGLNNHTRHQVASILLSKGVEVFVAAAFLLLMAHSLVTRHLRAMADHVANLNIEVPFPPLRLQNRSAGSNDEPDQVVESLNSMQERGQKAYFFMKENEKRVRQVQKLEAVGKLSGSFAHEFGNPLLGIRYAIRGMIQDLDKNSPHWQTMHLAQSECERMQRLITDLQNFNRPTNSEQVPLDLHELLDSILLLYTQLFTKQDITLCKEYGNGPAIILGVDDQIRQVFINFLINAIEALGDKGGQITVRVECLENSLVQVSLTDDGPGIPEEDYSRIFEPFFTTKDEVEGIGLGLSVSYGIVKAHYGTIEVDSSVGQGTTFIVTFPFYGMR